MMRLSKSVIGKEEISAVTRVLENEYLGMGEQVREFEVLLSNFFKREAVCVNTGTTALHLALQAIGVKPGDEVLVQSLTYVATFQAITATGAKPIPCEVDPDTLTIDLEDAKRKMSGKTRAIIPVHYGGGVGDFEAVLSFAKQNNIRVIEDAAHAFGTTFKNELVGSIGDICCFSFDGIKNITSGEGGVVVSHDKALLEKIKDLRLLGVEKDTEKRYAGERSWEFDVTEQGWRCHMSNIMAAIGIEQLKKFNGFKEKRQMLSLLYQEKLNDCNGVNLLDHNYNEVVPHIFVIKVSTEKRDLVREVLQENNIQTGIHYYPNHKLSKFKSDNYDFPITDHIYNQLITLPLHPGLTEGDVCKVCDIIRSVLIS